MEIKRQSSKRKIFCILEILKYYSDEDHYINSSKIESLLLEKYSIKAERKSIYSDINILKECGFNILSIGKEGYCLADRKFELAEIRMLNDAVQSARFITPKKTKLLSDKLCAELSVYQSEKLKSQKYPDNPFKFSNEHILYVIDTINTAIYENKKIHFDYYHKAFRDKKIKRVFSREHMISPYALIWSDEKYYVVGNYEKYNNLSHYRVDRMDNVTITDKLSRSFEEVCDYRGKFDSSDYAGRTFRMYSGKNEKIVLRCEMSILEKIIDKFGENAEYVFINEDEFEIITTGYNSEGLLEWLMMFANKCRVVTPEKLRFAVEHRAEDIIKVQKTL